ncbi:MAG: APC family permease [Candidatus Eremiobacter antarcticus]|nr:APC family permease [Candidatus Eremiobacteraeota bacterium]MBC5807102.1 APC family permease [Candidatus Eremiobacteraeota bacterium]
MPNEGLVPLAPTGLRREVLGFWEVVAQSVANIAPSATPALIVPLAVAATGNATWLAYVFATTALLLVTFHINQFAKRSSSPGSLYTYVAKGLGPTWGVITGWCLVIAYLIIGGSVLAGAANYIKVLAHLFVRGHDVPLTVFAMILVAAAAWYVAYRDIKLSTQFMLALEFLSVSLILILAMAYFLKARTIIDPAQFSFARLHISDIRQGLVLAIFSYVGFESATALGHEAKNPLHSIPRAIPLTVIAVGALFVFMTYTLVLAFHGQKPPLSESNAPLNVLSQLAGIPVFGIVISVGVIISFFACALACMNAGSRVLFAMSRHGLFHSSAGDAHKVHATPHVAVNVAAVVVLGAPLAMFLSHVAVLNIFGYLGAIGTFGVLFAYVFISLASPRYLKSLGELTGVVTFASIITILLLAIPIAGSLYPIPAAPYNYLPYIFLAMLAVGVARFAYLRLTKPGIIAAIQKDLISELLPAAEV